MTTLCPSCRQPMLPQRFERKLQGEVEIDLCFSCQAIWFDDFESVQLTPGGIIELFKLIHQHRDDLRQPLRDVLTCPRCQEKLLHGMDVAKGGHFNYHRCLQKHGRFTTFAQFMIEKGFVRQLSGTEIQELAAKIGIVRCSGCGAPIDIRKDHACSHCAAPISILDPKAVELALARFQEAEDKRTTCDVELLGDAIVMREREKSLQQRQRQLQGGNVSEELADIGDLLISGVDLIRSLLHR
jgi:Zn-finger nucleic acid-binding protein